MVFISDIAGLVVCDGEVRLHGQDVVVRTLSDVGGGVVGRCWQVRGGTVVVHVLYHWTRSSQHCALCTAGACVSISQRDATELLVFLGADREDFMILACAVLTSRWMDGRTPGPLLRQGICIASYADAL